MAGDYSENTNYNQQYHYTSEQLPRLNNDNDQYYNQHQQQQQYYHNNQQPHNNSQQQPQQHSVDIDSYHLAYVF